jgi:hypothetical protein|tara:strand:+ start:453 stop:650 length:198 start_codon:yes stop_codon:yes gene_type:complete
MAEDERIPLHYLDERTLKYWNTIVDNLEDTARRNDAPPSAQQDLWRAQAQLKKITSRWRSKGYRV